MADIHVEFCGITCANPVMPAAGPNAADADALLRAAAGGAGALVMKTISVKPARVPKPCMVKYGADGMLNCELWSELPAEQYIATEYAKAKACGLPLIASIGYSAEDLAELGPKVAATGVVDAIEFSLHYTGAGYEPVLAAAKALRAAVRLPILAKLSPGMPDIGALAKALEPFVDGFVAVNSAGPGLVIDAETGAARLGAQGGFGWLSGAPLKPLALRCVFEIARAVSKPVLGVGGISSGRDAIEFFMAGATAVQICTAAILRGPEIYGKVAREISDWLDAHGLASLDAVRNAFVNKQRTKQPLDFAGAPPAVDAARCVRCGLCVRSCPPGALALKDKQWALNAPRCVRCGLCVSVCPHNALR